MSVATISLLNEENLETFFLIWLDASVNNSEENIDAQKQLRASINYLKTFEDENECEKYIRSISKDDRIVLIISGRLGELVVPRIHSLQQVFSIYVYCKDKKRNETWAKQFKKVKGVVILLDELISLIRSDQKERNRKKIDEPLAINTTNYEESTSDLDGQFVSSQLLIDCLLRMKSNARDKQELILLSKQYYQGNEYELSIIDAFEKTYSSDQALWWYTRDTFLYRFMNKAFRVLNIDLLYLFRFFIRDIHEQLQKYQTSTFHRVYRGQLMSKDEINSLKNSIGKSIAMNSYLSTSINREKALVFLNDSTYLEKVLFEIDADPKLKGLQPFAYIKSYSYYPEEEEVLFMAGSVFQLISINYENSNLWIIRLILTGNENHDSNSIINQIKNEHSQVEANILTFGNILRYMGKFDQAEKYYHHFLNQSPRNSLDTANCYYSLGVVASIQGKYDQSLQWHLDSLEMKIQILRPDDLNIATSHNSIGTVYRKKGSYEQALQSYEKALSIWKKSLGDSHPKIAVALNNIGAVYEDEKNYSKALEYYEFALHIARKCSPIDLRAISATYNNLGNVCYKLNNYDSALEHYIESFQTKSKFLPKHHPALATALRNIGMVYEKKGDMSKASEFYKRASDIKC